MRLLKKMSLLSVMLLIVLLSVPLTNAQNNGIDYGYSSGFVSLTTNDIDVRVTTYNQAPRFQWWNTSSQGLAYNIMFLKMFEINDVNENGAYDLGTDTPAGAPSFLPSEGWTFSGFETIERNSVVEFVTFNYTASVNFTSPTTITGPPTTSTPAPISDSNHNEVNLRISVHLNISNPSQIKFDVYLSNWEWTADDSILVFHFIVTESLVGQDVGNTAPPNFTSDDNRFEFGAGYLEYAKSAIANDSSIPVAGTFQQSQDEGATAIYLAFSNFGNASLAYDPTIGIYGSTSTTSSTITTATSPTTSSTIPGTNIEYEELLLVFGALSLIVIVVSLLKRSKNGTI